MTPKVYSLRKGAEPPPPDAVYVGRGTPWGNPFIMRGESKREEVCRMFEAYAYLRMRNEPDWLKPLRGKSLVCWCQSPGDVNPKRCHAQTLLRLANAEPEVAR